MNNVSIIWLDKSEGPFDLLLELVREEKIDVSRVSLSNITDHFLAYMAKKTISPEVLADFILVASTLLLIKIRRLLPKTTTEDDEEINSLTERVKFYQLYREKAQFFAKAWQGIQLFPAHYLEDSSKKKESSILPDVSATQLQQAFLQVIQQTPKEALPTRHLITKGKSLQQCLALFTERLKTHTNFIFQEAVQSENTQNVATSFLAILELARTQKISLTQEKHFGPISIKRTA